MRVLITGSRGLLGRHLLATKPQGFEIVGTSRLPNSSSTMKVVSTDSLSGPSLEDKISEIRPDLIIHTAGEGRVDAVEKDSEQFRFVNAEWPVKMAAAALRAGLPFVFVSSNAVFQGGTGEYTDFSPASPNTHYGRFKAEAEQGVTRVHPGSLIVRPILMYGWPSSGYRSNLVHHIISQLEAGAEVRAVEDVHTEPLAALEAAKVIWKASMQGMTGPLNLSGGTTMSLFELAGLTAKVFGLDPTLVKPVTSDYFGSLLPRPKRTSFDLKRLKEELVIDPVPPLQGLKDMRDNRGDACRGEV